MGETSKDEAAEILLSLKKTGHPREFFKDSEFSNSQLDLNLGLSLGGCYSHIPTEKPLSRSSSLTKVVTPDKNEGEFLSLARSSSLQPIEPGQEHRMIKRNEASRRVLDKQRCGWGGSDEKWPPVKAVPPKEVIARAVQSAIRNAALRRAIMKIKADGKSFAKQKIQGRENSTLNRSRDNIKPVVTSEARADGKSVKPARTRSVPVVTSEAMANGKSVKPARTRSVPVASSGTMATGKQFRFAETDEQKNPSKKIIVSNAGTEEQENLSKKIRVSHSGIQDNGMKNSGTDEQKNPSKKIRVSHSGMQDNGMKAIMEQMPGVTTTGDGPNGRKIEGFLYKYRKGHVSIVCVCHGNFLSPVEFVKHAGGSDVANPMKHINVLPPSF